MWLVRNDLPHSLSNRATVQYGSPAVAHLARLGYLIFINCFSGKDSSIHSGGMYRCIDALSREAHRSRSKVSDKLLRGATWRRRPLASTSRVTSSRGQGPLTRHAALVQGQPWLCPVDRLIGPTPSLRALPRCHYQIVLPINLGTTSVCRCSSQCHRDARCRWDSGAEGDCSADRFSRWL